MRYFSILFLCSFFVFHNRAMQQVCRLSSLAGSAVQWNKAVHDAHQHDYRLGYEYCMAHWKEAWQLLAKPIVLPSPHNRVVLSSIFIRNENRVITVDVDGNICLWNLATRELEWVQKGHAMKIDSVAIRSDQRYIATASEDGTAVLWELESQFNENEKKTFSLRRVITMQHEEAVTAVALNFHEMPDGRPCEVEVFTGSQSGRVRMFSARTGVGRCLNERGPLPGWVRCLSISPDNASISAGVTGSVLVCDRNTGSLKILAGDETMSATSMALTTDAVVWGTLFGDLEMKVGNKQLKHPISKSAINSIAWSPDKELIVSGNLRSKGCLPKIFLATVSPDTGYAPLKTFDGASLFISTIVINPDKGDILIGDGNGSVMIYSIRQAAEKLKLAEARFILQELPRLVYKDQFNRDGRYIIDLRNGPWTEIYNGLHDDIKGILARQFVIIVPSNHQ